MSLDEEIAILQFGQGIRADGDVLAQFTRLGEEERPQRLMELRYLLSQSKLTDADLEQALTVSRLGADYLPCVNVKQRVTISRPGNKPEDDYKFMLHLFRVAYQRWLADKGQHPGNWWYWDLSQPGVEQRVQAAHQALVNELYNTPGFRSEFTSLAKLQHEEELNRTKRPDRPVPVSQYHYDFMTYDEVRTESIKLLVDKPRWSMMILRHSLEKALLVRYKLAPVQVSRLVAEVIGRHRQENYGTELPE